jgi:acyl-CoA thioesterase FadM
MGHVNNVVYNFWAETARINWVRSFALQIEDDAAQRAMWDDLISPKGIGLILRSIKTEYKLPLQYPDRVTVIHKLLQEPKMGMDALHLEAVVLSETHQRIAARITEDIAVYDYRIQKKAPLPDFMVETFMQEWQDQQKAMKDAANHRGSIESKLRDLEQQTWDRSDAVEDMGSATIHVNATEQEQKDHTDADLAPSEEEVTTHSSSPESDQNLTKTAALLEASKSTRSKQASQRIDGDEAPLEYQVSTKQI